MTVKKMPKGKIDVEEPEIEVTVRAGDEELAVIAFFDAGATEWDILVGVSNPALRESLIIALQSAAAALAGAAFRPIPTRDTQGGDNPPPF
jgi:hypothetical protein